MPAPVTVPEVEEAGADGACAVAAMGAGAAGAAGALGAGTAAGAVGAVGAGATVSSDLAQARARSIKVRSPRINARRRISLLPTMVHTSKRSVALRYKTPRALSRYFDSSPFMFS
ncbi:MAG: hypothetical protein FJ315_03700 [SAR202 cluster bacterium]|nr:hypothetical protein [SAR202 cluster bacterium]